MRERRNYFLLMGAIAAALVGAVMLAVPGSPIYQKPTLGLDLQGGLEVILRATPPKGTQLTTQGMQTAQQIMEKRANGTGVAAPSVAIQGNDEIVIQLAGVHDPAKAAKVVGTTGSAPDLRLRDEPRAADGVGNRSAGAGRLPLQACSPP